VAEVSFLLAVSSQLSATASESNTSALLKVWV